MLEQAKQRFIEAGGNLQAQRVRTILERAEERARREAEGLSAPPHPGAANWIKEALSKLAIGFFAAVLIFGVFAVLVAVPVAEFAAVYAGLSLVTPYALGVAFLTASAAFFGILVLMFLRHVYEDSLPGDKPQTGVKYTVNRVKSYLGFSASPDASWTKVERDYVNFSSGLTLMQAAILLASFVGRIGSLITRHGSKPLSEALISIQTDLTGSEFIGVVISLVLLLGLLRLLDTVVLFCYTAFKNSAGALDLAKARPVSFLDEYSRLKEIYEAETLNDLSLQLEARNNETTT